MQSTIREQRTKNNQRLPHPLAAPAATTFINTVTLPHCVVSSAAVVRSFRFVYIRAEIYLLSACVCVCDCIPTKQPSYSLHFDCVPFIFVHMPKELSGLFISYIVRINNSNIRF